MLCFRKVIICFKNGVNKIEIFFIINKTTMTKQNNQSITYHNRLTLIFKPILYQPKFVLYFLFLKKYLNYLQNF